MIRTNACVCSVCESAGMFVAQSCQCVFRIRVVVMVCETLPLQTGDLCICSVREAALIYSECESWLSVYACEVV